MGWNKFQIQSISNVKNDDNWLLFWKIFPISMPFGVWWSQAWSFGQASFSDTYTSIHPILDLEGVRDCRQLFSNYFLLWACQKKILVSNLLFGWLQKSGDKKGGPTKSYWPLARDLQKWWWLHEIEMLLGKWSWLQVTLLAKIFHKWRNLTQVISLEKVTSLEVTGRWPRYLTQVT